MEKCTIPQSKALKPYRQGQLDKLCGLYSIINAIRLAAYPQKRFTKFHVSIIMREGLIYLHSRPERLLDSLIEGMPRKRKRSLATHIIKFVNKVWNLKLEIVKPIIDKDVDPRPILTTFIEKSITASHPVCININGHHDHYTVIVGYNPRSYILHDSDGLKSIQRSLISIAGDKERARHKLSSSGVFIISTR